MEKSFNSGIVDLVYPYTNIPVSGIGAMLMTILLNVKTHC